MSSCRGRAEAFARQLSCKLRTLSSQTDEDQLSKEDEPVINGSSINNWMTAHSDGEHLVTDLQPLRQESDSYFDFDCTLESPGSPTEECEYLKLIETTSNTPYNSATESGYACASAASSHSSNDIPHSETTRSEISNIKGENNQLQKTDQPKQQQQQEALQRSCNLVNVIEASTKNIFNDGNIANVCQYEFHDADDEDEDDEPESSKINHSLTQAKQQDARRNKDNSQIVEQPSTIRPPVDYGSDVKDGAARSPCADQMTESQLAEIQHQIIKELQECSKNVVTPALGPSTSLLTTYSADIITEVAGDENICSINATTHPPQTQKASQNCPENADEILKIELTDIQLSDKSINKPFHLNTNTNVNVNTTTTIAITANTSEDNDNKTSMTQAPGEKCTISPTKLTVDGQMNGAEICDEQRQHQLHAFSTASALDATDEEEDGRPQRVRRCSSLKTGKTPPGTPGRKKIVRFADVLGLDLADVKTFLDEIPTIPKSAFEDLEVIDITSSIQFGPKIGKMLMPLFQQPGGLSTFLDLVREKQVSLENAAITDHINLTITGTVRVRNLDFHKSVHIRYTFDNWRSFADLQANYVGNSCDGFSDKFTFMLFCNTLQVGQRVEFAVRFQCRGQQFWDNNYGSNYCFQCLPTSSPRPDTVTPILPPKQAHDNAGLLSPTTGEAWCSSFY